jgi:hypothetical protein
MACAADGASSPADTSSPSVPLPSTVLFQENFEDAALASRGWYDLPSAGLTSLTRAEHAAGSAQSIEVRFLVGRTNSVPTVGGRHLFTPTESVFLSYWVKYSSNWIGSGRSYHPHEFHFVTTEDDAYVGPAYTRLTAYIEHNYEAAGGVAVFAIQDARNVDVSRINQDLTTVTENRAVAGCNGNWDGTASSCYQSGSLYLNGKSWRSSQTVFTAASGPRYKGNWHKVEVYLKLNSIQNGKGQADGIAQYWVDGQLVLDKRNLFFRTAARASMKFNQFLMAPYIGDGSPADQTMWIDDIVVATAPPSGR